jgi:heptose I phosphotransferase
MIASGPNPEGTLWQRLTRGVRRVQQRSDWEHFAGPGWLDAIMSAPVTDRFHAKQGRSTGRWILRANGGSLAVYLKRHYRLAWWRGLLAVLCPRAGWSPALQEWRHLEWARAHGVPVPAPVAVGEYIGPWTRLQSFLAIEELTGMLPLHEAIPAAAARMSTQAFERWKRGLTGELARLIRTLHARRGFHKDLYLCHFYVPTADSQTFTDWTGRVHLIDLHRLAQHPWTWPLRLVKDLAQLLYSSDVPGVGIRDRVRFWRAYRGSGRRGWLARWLLAAILAKARRYRRHNNRPRRASLPSALGRLRL